MADIDQLKEKLRQGKNEASEGYQKFASAQFYGKYEMVLITDFDIDY